MTIASADDTSKIAIVESWVMTTDAVNLISSVNELLGDAAVDG